MDKPRTCCGEEIYPYMTCPMCDKYIQDDDSDSEDEPVCRCHTCHSPSNVKDIHECGGCSQTGCLQCIKKYDQDRYPGIQIKWLCENCTVCELCKKSIKKRERYECSGECSKSGCSSCIALYKPTSSVHHERRCNMRLCKTCCTNRVECWRCKEKFCCSLRPWSIYRRNSNPNECHACATIKCSLCKNYQPDLPLSENERCVKCDLMCIGCNKSPKVKYEVPWSGAGVVYHIKWCEKCVEKVCKSVTTRGVMCDRLIPVDKLKKIRDKKMCEHCFYRHCFWCNIDITDGIKIEFMNKDHAYVCFECAKPKNSK
jgi:hypothetical protein